MIERRTKERISVSNKSIADAKVTLEDIIKRFILRKAMELKDDMI